MPFEIHIDTPTVIGFIVAYAGIFLALGVLACLGR
jgi:hypothetical protein